ncbi:MAG: UvrD-helicase domain-containing protein [Clostridia bacterium]|nr:UvrD-helicase domain-containing protein [Clostridia bacterium]
MPAANHPAYQEELERCRYTLDYVGKTLEATLGKKEKLDKEVDRIKKHLNSDSSSNYVDLMVNTLLQGSMELKLRNLITARSKPYFARVDFQEDGKKDSEKLYIGKMSLMRDEDQQVIIVDWRAPIANLYYEERLGEAHYFCPDGDIQGKMLTKRQFSINEGILQDIFDIDITTNDDFLQSYLGASADNRLKEIVSTIQTEQNKIIRADMWRPMVVQGAAGSGKTTIALHRIAYLIYNHEKTLKPENFMIIAPNRLFLNYISEVLPELGVERVVQSTFESFAVDLLGKKFKVKDPNEKLALFMTRPGEPMSEESRKLFKATELKASMKFKTIMDRYVEHIEKDFIPKENFTIEGVIVYPYKEIDSLFKGEYKRWALVKRMDEIKKHLNNRLKSMKSKIINRLNDECDDRIMHLKETMEDNEERHKLIVEAIDKRDERIKRLESNAKKAVNDYIKRISKFSPWEYYFDLMKDTKLLLQLSVGLADTETVTYLAEYTNKVIKAGFIEVEDFAPLTYLKYLIYGIDEKIPVRQIIIDEAQDFSIFQLYALRKIIKDSSFTILGDLCQGIHSYRGIKDWKEVLAAVFEDKKPEYLTLEQSYRTSVEIMEAANDVISALGNEDFLKAKPVIRHGEPVKSVRVKDEKEMISDLCKQISDTRNDGLKSIAVICKTLEECISVHPKIAKAVPEANLITGKEDQYKGGIVVVPSYLSKGLEFDAVFIANAEQFGKSELDIKLLYVAMTRALHKLTLYYV